MAGWNSTFSNRKYIDSNGGFSSQLCEFTDFTMHIFSVSQIQIASFEGNIFSDFKTRIVVSWRTLDLWEDLQDALMPSEAGRILKFSRVFFVEEGECRWLHIL